MQDVECMNNDKLSNNKLVIILIPIMIIITVISMIILYNVGINVGNIIHYLLSNTSC